MVRLMAVGIWFQIWGAAEEKGRRPKSVLALGTCRRDWLWYGENDWVDGRIWDYKGKQVVEWW